MGAEVTGDRAEACLFPGALVLTPHGEPAGDGDGQSAGIGGTDGFGWADFDPAVLLGGRAAGDAVDPWSTFDQLPGSTMDLNLPNMDCVTGGPIGGRGMNMSLDVEPEPERNGLLPKHPSTEDILVALARLSESVSQQLSWSKAYHAEMRTSNETGTPPPEPPNVNVVATALKSTSDLAKILQALSEHHAAQAPTDRQHAPPNPITTPTALLVLTSYMQLIQLYDIIFQSLARVFRETPDAIGTCPSRAGSQFLVAGVSNIDGRLFVKLLLQVIEHHIDTVERLLGLPAEFSVSGRKPRAGGLLSDDEGLMRLVEVVMARDDADGSGSGRDVVASLRGGIQDAKDML